MAKIKHTKTELKAQREALRRYERFLPMLQLKKQQLQLEIQAITGKIGEIQSRAAAIRGNLAAWVKLLAEPAGLDALIVLRQVETAVGNIAGVNIPVLRNVLLEAAQPDLMDTPPWVDDALDTVTALINCRVEQQVLERQRDLITHELRVTTQRVNLFEKVKIPECRENIRVIKIFLGDEQTAAVARGKIAKRRTQTYEYEGTDVEGEAVP